MKISRFFLTWICVFTFLLAFGQQQEGYWIIHRLIEELLPETEDEVIAEEITESLFYLYENPLDINNATEDQLKELIFLNEKQIHDLLVYIKEKGELLSVFELQLIDGFDERTVQRIAPFITVAPLRNRSAGNLRNDLLVRMEGTLERKKGFLASPSPEKDCYEGSSMKRLLKFKSYRANKFSAGIVMENDPGETFRWEPKKSRHGADYISGHLAIEPNGTTGIIIGDYQISAGQGTALSHAFSVGKSSESVRGVRKTGRTLKPYSGSHEYNFFRGLAASFSYNNFTLVPFFSKKQLDARINFDPETEAVFATSLINTGMHRTKKEMAARHNLSEIVYGSDIQYDTKRRNFSAGLLFAKTHFEVPLHPAKNMYNQFAFTGDNLLNSSFRINYLFKNINLFGEMSAADMTHWAGLLGMQAVLTPNASMAFLYRNYGKAYHTFYGQAFGESSTNNEEGFYWGLNIDINRQWKVNLYYDVFSFPWMKYQNYSVYSKGHEFLSKVSFSPNKRSLLYFQFKTESKERNMGSTSGVQQTSLMKKDQCLLNIDMNPTGMINLKFRVQGSVFDSQSGVALSQDLNLLFDKIRLYNRFAVFDTDSYDNRQYMYEKDVLYAFTFPALYGKGTRFYSMLELKAKKNLSLWIRFARTCFYDRQVIGSGLEEIDGSKKSDLKLQARYVF